MIVRPSADSFLAVVGPSTFRQSGFSQMSTGRHRLTTENWPRGDWSDGRLTLCGSLNIYFLLLDKEQPGGRRHAAHFVRQLIEAMPTWSQVNIQQLRICFANINLWLSAWWSVDESLTNTNSNFWSYRCFKKLVRLLRVVIRCQFQCKALFDLNIFSGYLHKCMFFSFLIKSGIDKSAIHLYFFISFFIYVDF